MKIGIDIRTLMHAQYSGIPEYTFNLVKGLIEKDRDNEYVLFYNSFKDLSSHIPNFQSKNVKIVKTSYPNKIFNYILQKGIHAPKIDDMLGVDVFFMPHINFASLGINSKKFITIHDLSFLRYPQFFSAKQNIWHFLINVRKLLSQFEVIIAVSENTKRDLIELCEIPEEKIVVIYSGVNSDFKKVRIRTKKKDKLEKKYNLPKDFILYLGTIEPRKNVDGIIMAYEDFRDKNKDKSNVSLVLAGANGWKSKHIYKTWEKSKYKEDIQFLGFVDREDKVFLYNLAKLFVYPSFYEGFGFPPLEAILSSTAVVTSNISSLPEIIGENAVFVNPYKIDEISNAFSIILNNQELFNKNEEINSSIYDWDNVVDKYINLFKS